MSTMVLALDLGKFNSVLCWYESEDRPLQRLDTTHGLRGDGPTPVAKVKVRSRLAPRPQIVDLSAEAEARQPRSGIGPPVAPEVTNQCPTTTSPTHTTAASTCTPEASSSISATPPVLTNTWRKHHRQATRLPTATGDPNLAPGTPPVPRRALAIVRVDFEAQTWKACWEFVVNERSAAEVSAELGISENAVYLAKSRILRHLRTELAGLLDD